MATELWAVALAVSATLVGAFGPILLKKGSERKLRSIKSLIKNYPLIGGISLYGFATVLFIAALRGGELSVLYPVIALMYIWVSLLSVKILNERMTRNKWAGIALIIIGVSLIGLGS